MDDAGCEDLKLSPKFPADRHPKGHQDDNANAELSVKALLNIEPSWPPSTGDSQEQEAN